MCVTKGWNFLLIALSSAIVVGVGVNRYSRTSKKLEQPAPITITEAPVPLPQDTDSIRSFFYLINDHNSADAISYLSQDMVGDEGGKQAWGMQFNAFDTVTVSSVEPWQKDSWTESTHTYKVTVDVRMKPSAAAAPIPNYGWEQGINVRWITLVRVGPVWRITSISTGP